MEFQIGNTKFRSSYNTRVGFYYKMKRSTKGNWVKITKALHDNALNLYTKNILTNLNSKRRKK